MDPPRVYISNTLSLARSHTRSHLRMMMLFIYTLVCVCVIFMSAFSLWLCINIEFMCGSAEMWALFYDTAHHLRVCVCVEHNLFDFFRFWSSFFPRWFAGWLLLKSLKTYLIFPRFIFSLSCSWSAFISLAVGFLSIVVTIAIHLVCCLLRWFYL